MDSAETARLARTYGILLLVLGLAAVPLLAMLYQTDPHLIERLILHTVVNAFPGAILLFLSGRMDRAELWAFIATAGVAVLLVLEYLLMFVIGAKPRRQAIFAAAVSTFNSERPFRYRASRFSGWRLAFAVSPMARQL